MVRTFVGICIVWRIWGLWNHYFFLCDKRACLAENGAGGGQSRIPEIWADSAPQVNFPFLGVVVLSALLRLLRLGCSYRVRSNRGGAAAPFSNVFYIFKRALASVPKFLNLQRNQCMFEDTFKYLKMHLQTRTCIHPNSLCICNETRARLKVHLQIFECIFKRALVVSL